MKKNILTIISCFLMLLVATGCQNQTKDKPTNLEDTYKAISYYFSNSQVDKSNLGSFYIDNEKNIIIVELVENTPKNQETFLKLTNIDKKYIEFKQGGPYKNDDIDIELSVAFDQTCGNVEFNEYLNDDNIKVYLEENVNDYKDKDKNITIIACNTLDGNRDVYIGEYQLYYKENMCK